MTHATMGEKPDAENPHVRSDGEKVAPAMPRRGSLLYKKRNRVGALALLFVIPAFAYGPWLDWTPTGSMEIGGPDAVDRATLSRNNSATAGCGKEGPTALMLSNLKLDLAESHNGHILDIILPSSIIRSKTAAADIASILKPYFDRGGNCLHLNCFDSKTLRDALAHPEKYEDLQVRVCGWNVRWNDLSRPEQLHFIATAEAQE